MFLAVSECFLAFLDGFGAFRTLVLALETTRGDRYLRRQVYGDSLDAFNLAFLIFANTGKAYHAGCSMTVSMVGLTLSLTGN